METLDYRTAPRTVHVVALTNGRAAWQCCSCQNWNWWKRDERCATCGLTPHEAEAADVARIRRELAEGELVQGSLFR